MSHASAASIFSWSVGHLLHQLVGVILAELHRDFVEAVDELFLFALGIDIVPDVERGIDVRLLLKIAHLGAGERLGFAGEVIVQPGHDLHQRGFARAVDADNADLRVREKAEPDVLEHLLAARIGLVRPCIEKMYCAGCAMVFASLKVIGAFSGPMHTRPPPRRNRARLAQLHQHELGGALMQPQTVEKSKSSRKSAAKTAAALDAIALLKADHRQVEDWFEQFEKTRSDAKKKKLANSICKALTVHTEIEEEIFYVACRQAGIEEDLMDEADIEHDGAKKLIAEIEAQAPGDDHYDARVKVLSEMIKHHVKEEEQKDGMFARAKKADLDLKELGAEMKARKDELMRAS